MKKLFFSRRVIVQKATVFLLVNMFVVCNGPGSYADTQIRNTCLDTTTLAPQVHISDERVHAFLRDHMQALQKQLNSDVTDLDVSRDNSTIEVTFTHYAPKARRVDVLLGGFSSWEATENTVMTKDKSGVWKLTMTLPRGVNYQYKFLEDNAYWVQDRNNTNRNVDVNQQGVRYINSVVTDNDAGVRNNVTVDFYIENAEAVYFLSDANGWEEGTKTAMSPVRGNVYIKNTSAIYEGMQYKFLVLTKAADGSLVRTWYFDQQNKEKATATDAQGNVVQNSLLTPERIADFRLLHERQKSRLLTNLMQDAANRGDIDQVNKALEKARVSGLPGRKEDKPFLLIVGGEKESPVRVAFATESIDSIRYTL
jgi:hypothetical protein